MDHTSEIYYTVIRLNSTHNVADYRIWGFPDVTRYIKKLEYKDVKMTVIKSIAGDIALTIYEDITLVLNEKWGPRKDVLWRNQLAVGN